MTAVLDVVDPATRAVLERFGFDAERFERLRARVADGSLSKASNVVQGTIEAPHEGDLTPLPAPGEPECDAAREAGTRVLRRGEVASLVLAGGMATRFGGVVKSLVEVVGGRSFLELKLADTVRIADALGARVPTAVMTSFATDEQTRSFVAERRLGEPLVFAQFVSLRLEPGGGLFRGPDGRPSPYAPGHGDLFEAIRSSGTLSELSRRGVRHLVVSNVDNLGARIDPLVIGAHVLSGRPLTVEVACAEGDLGGAPVRVDGRLQLVEGPCFPSGFDQSLLPVFNTNTATFALHALETEHELRWLYVEKDVAGRTAVQLERMYHEVSARLPTTYLVVPRTGPRGRFFPIKTPEDLDRSRSAVGHLLARLPVDD